MNGTPRAPAAWPSTHESPPTKISLRSGQRSPMTRSPRGAGPGAPPPERPLRGGGGDLPETVLETRDLLANEANQFGGRPAGVPRREGPAPGAGGGDGGAGPGGGGGGG